MQTENSNGASPAGFLGKKGMTIRVWNNNVNSAISQLKKRMNTEGITKEYRARQHFETNTLKRRRKLAEAKARWRKKQAQIMGLEKPKRRRSRPGS